MDTTLVSEIHNIIKKRKMLPLQQGKEKHVSILCDKSCEEQAFPHLLPTSKFGL